MLDSIFTFNDVQYDLKSRTFIMGVLNVTPDSFSDGGKYSSIEKAVEHGLQMINDGADFIDVGGESTKPGAEPVTVEEEIKRVVPVVEELHRRTKIPISIDTYKSEVAEQAINAGAIIVNDISGLQFDSKIAEIVSNKRASVVLMHIKGTPKSMQESPAYVNVIEEIYSYLQKSIRIAKEKGIKQIIIDPGIGFGKTVEHNLQILKNLRSFEKLGFPILVGPSRKSFIGRLLDVPIDQRLEGTAAASAVAIMNCANIIRVHDVKEIKRVARIVDAVINS